MSKDYRILQGDVRDVLAMLPDESVHMVCTSPPYWGLRSYSTEPQIWGGDVDCEHEWGNIGKPFHPGQVPQTKWQNVSAVADGGRAGSGQYCRLCGAWYGDLGLEPTPGEFVQHMVEIFRDVRRVLRRDGTCWVNMGDSYANAGAHNNGGFNERYHGKPPKGTDKQGVTDTHKPKYTRVAPGLKPKDLVGMPWRVAFALQEDGWYLRSAITWCKRAPMPESVTDRPTSATEMIFLLAKSERYYYDADAVREEHQHPTVTHISTHKTAAQEAAFFGNAPTNLGRAGNHPLGRNLWNYWLLGPEPYAAAHFAVFPSAIPDRCIRAGTSERGVCPQCGAPWRRVVERTGADNKANEVIADYDVPGLAKGTPADRVRRLSGATYQHVVKGTNQWQPTCKCGRTDTVPATVLDPFSGAGTTCLVALRLGRRAIGIELNPTYIELSHKRIQSDPAAMNLNMELVEMEESA